MKPEEVEALLADYQLLVERVEATWVWSEYDLDHDQSLREALEGVDLPTEGKARLESLDARYLNATHECPRWRKYTGDRPGFWWRFPNRVGDYWDDFWTRQ